MTSQRTSLMKSTLGAAIAAAMLTIAPTTFAAAVITAVDFDVNSLGGSVNSISIDNDHNIINLDKVFTAIEPITLRFTVGHSQGGPNSYDLVELITNSTGVAWTDYHFSIVEPAGGNGITFGAFQGSTLNGFDLDNPPVSGPRALNFTGSLATGGTMHASFEMHLFDPGANSTYTFDLVQNPTVGAETPVPVPMAAWLMASGLLGLSRFTKRRSVAAARS